MGFDPPLSLAEAVKAFGKRYSVTEQVFTGGQGAVFKATPTGVDLVVALKIYFPEQMSERTEREIAALHRLKSPAVVRLFDSGKVAIRGLECLYVATDFIEGEPLSDTIRRYAMPREDVARLGVDIATAIDALWRERIVHRDIKPPNIIRAEDGRGVLIDLGVARHLTLNTITSAGVTWGTLGYMAPEHVKAQRQLTCKADIFSLGIVLQECLLGRHPVNRRQDLLQAGGPSCRSLGVAIPEKFGAIVDAMVHREAFRRPLPIDVINDFRQFV